MNTDQYLSIYTGWELKGNNRKRFEYDSNKNITHIYLEELQKDGTWKVVRQQELIYDSNSCLLTITCKTL